MKISIVVPIYNVEEYLEQCIESLINQTYNNLEIILIDDNSTDHSALICEKYAKEDSRIVFLKNEKNQGVVYTRGVGFEYAHGEYISCVDADDWLDIDAYSKIVSIIYAYAPDMIIYNYYKEYNSYSEEIKEQFSEDLYEYADYERCLKENQFFYTPFISQSLCNKVIKTDLVKKYEKKIPRELNILEDALLSHSCFLNAEKMYFIDKSYYHYRSRQGSAMFKNTRKEYDSFITYIKCMTDIFLEKKIPSEKARKMFLDHIFYNLLLCNPKMLLAVNDFGKCKAFPQITEGKKIILYGKGSIGTKIFKAFEKKGIVRFTAWIDSSDKKMLEKINQEIFDYILVAVVNSKIVKNIERLLWKRGVSRDKILTFNDMDRSEYVLPKEIQEILGTELKQHL